MRFEFGTAARIVFGPGAVAEVPPAARALGRRALLVSGGHARSAALDASLRAATVETVPLLVETEPAVDLARHGAALARSEQCQIVVAIGGGSAIDAGKAIAALLPNSGEPLDYLEVVGRGQPLTAPSVPFIAVPTTAGTGAEVTRNAVLASTEHRVKASLRSPYMLPRLAVVDPDLTLDMPPAVTASTGLDALTQVIEPYVSCRANPFTDLYCLEGIRCAARSLVRAFENGQDRGARQDMSFAALLGGLALANAGLGAVHGFAAPIGGSFSAPHGAVCAALLPHVMEANLRFAAPGTRGRYQTIAALLTGRSAAAPEDGVAWVREVCRRFAIPPLRSYGMTEADLPGQVEQAEKASSMKANPVKLDPESLAAILAAAL